MVGSKFLEGLADACLQDAEVTILCKAPHHACDRVHLSGCFWGKSAENLSVAEPGLFERTGFQLRLAARAVAIERRANTVPPADGEELVDEGGGRILRSKIEQRGVHARTSRSTVRVADCAEHLHRMVFEDGSYLETDMIVFPARWRGDRRPLPRQRPPCLHHRRMRLVARADLRSGDPGHDMARIAARHIAGDAQASFTGPT